MLIILNWKFIQITELPIMQAFPVNATFYYKCEIKILLSTLFSNTLSVCPSLNVRGPKRDEVTGEWRKLHNEELRDLNSSPSIIRIIKSRRKRWAGHLAQWGRRGTRIGYWWESQMERDH
jgi:hypothetical protein